MACLERASPALKQILLKIYHAEKPVEIDHHLHEFGSVEYHIQCSASDEKETYLSISTPLLSQGILLSYELLQHYTTKILKGIYFSDFMEIVEPPRQGYRLTLRLSLSRIPRRKDSVKIITEISSVQAVILSFQLKETLRNLNNSQGGTCKPIKLVYHPNEPFFVVKQPAKMTAIFPMRFKEKSDVIIATAFFQELMDVGSSEAFDKAPHCHWSPIPPPELRGEPIEDLSTNGGFVSFEISSRNVEGKKLDKIVWSLLNFYAFVKYHVKCTKGFIQRRMRNRLDRLVEALPNKSIDEDQHIEKVQKGCKAVRKLVNFSRTKTLRQRCDFANKIKRIRSGIKIYKFTRFRRRWMRIPKFSLATSYMKLD